MDEDFSLVIAQKYSFQPLLYQDGLYNRSNIQINIQNPFCTAVFYEHQ